MRLDIIVSKVDVCSPLLDNSKVWHAENKYLCGVKTEKLVQKQFFDVFPNELKKLNFRNVQTGDGEKPEPARLDAKYKTIDLFAISMFSFCGLLVRQRNLKDNRQLASEHFASLAEFINGYSLKNHAYKFQDGIQQEVVDFL